MHNTEQPWPDLDCMSLNSNLRIGNCDSGHAIDATSSRMQQRWLAESVITWDFPIQAARAGLLWTDRG
jgi:hypothetical protein